MMIATIAWQTSLTQMQTNAVDTPNKLLIVRYSDVLAKKYKVIANLRLAEIDSRSLVFLQDISFSIKFSIY